MSLHEIGVRHDTDKSPHGYMKEYDRRFGAWQDDPITLLEIGTWTGKSLRAFREFFRNATIVGMDIDPKWLPGPEDNIHFIAGSQEDHDDLARVAALGPFDVIIDDGGHLPSNHIASFRFLWRYVAPGGWYAIEDCFTLFNECWTKPEDSTILDDINDGLVESVLCSLGDIAEIQFVGGDKHPKDGLGHDDGLIFFRKKL